MAKKKQNQKNLKSNNKNCKMVKVNKMSRF